MTPEKINENSVFKVLTVRWRNHSYYVQSMPGLWSCGRDFAVMKDRERLYSGRFKSEKEAVKWLLQYLTSKNDDPELQFT